jgi:hypothetical protein
MESTETVRSLETLAVETFEHKTREKEEADRLRREQTQRRLDDHQSNFKDVYLPDTQTALAMYFGLAPDDQLVRDLEWSTEQSEWTPEVQRGFKTGGELASAEWPHLYATVAGVRLQVRLLDHQGQLGNITVRYVDGGSSGPVNTLEDLGELIIKRRREDEIRKNS